MKRQGGLILLPALMSMLLFAGCGQKQESANMELAGWESDLAYVQSKGTLVAGITDFAPMDYLDGGAWTGFDAELAEAFAESLGVSLELKEIDWNNKDRLLEQGDIDCIWNGMTMTPELTEAISCSEPYLSNAQVIVMQKEDLQQYRTIEECRHLLFAVEAGSAGEAFLKGKKYRCKACGTQKEALQSVLDKKVDATVIDIIMAAYNTRDGQEYDGLGFAISLNDEKICVGFRKGSDLTREADLFFQAAYEDGSIGALAEKYGLEDAVLK